MPLRSSSMLRLSWLTSCTRVLSMLSPSATSTPSFSSPDTLMAGREAEQEEGFTSRVANTDHNTAVHAAATAMEKVQHLTRSAMRRASQAMEVPPQAKQNMQELFVNFCLILICLLLIYIIVLLMSRLRGLRGDDRAEERAESVPCPTPLAGRLLRSYHKCGSVPPGERSRELNPLPALLSVPAESLVRDDHRRMGWVSFMSSEPGRSSREEPAARLLQGLALQGEEGATLSLAEPVEKGAGEGSTCAVGRVPVELPPGAERWWVIGWKDSGVVLELEWCLWYECQN
ncbi:hypothetical protein CRUP_025518 [Coryphaenoides rupestris]|nr:hypothetical protein CRUP_025518 [Coryphaenoides rupestris]